MHKRSPAEKQKLGRTLFLALFSQCFGAILPTLCCGPSFADYLHHTNSSCCGYSFQHHGSPLFQLHQSNLSPICCSHSTLLELFFPAVCTPLSGAVRYLPFMVTTLQHTQCASWCTHGLTLQSPLPANTCNGGHPLRS